jgi:hypothetical protein
LFPTPCNTHETRIERLPLVSSDPVRHALLPGFHTNAEADGEEASAADKRAARRRGGGSGRRACSQTTRRRTSAARSASALPDGDEAGTAGVEVDGASAAHCRTIRLARARPASALPDGELVHPFRIWHRWRAQGDAAPAEEEKDAEPASAAARWRQPHRPWQ